jgi:hypothetical protein
MINPPAGASVPLANVKESLDIFVMDLRYLDNDPIIKNLILNKLNDPNYFYKNLRNTPNYFILINE